KAVEEGKPERFRRKGGTPGEEGRTSRSSGPATRLTAPYPISLIPREPAAELHRSALLISATRLGRPDMIEQRYRQVLALLKWTNMLHRGLALGSAVVLLMVAAHPLFAPAREVPSFTRQEDVIYARKHGTALTMDVFTPKKNANGAAAILVVSGG